MANCSFEFIDSSVNRSGGVRVDAAGGGVPSAGVERNARQRPEGRATGGPFLRRFFSWRGLSTSMAPVGGAPRFLIVSESVFDRLLWIVLVWTWVTRWLLLKLASDFLILFMKAPVDSSELDNISIGPLEKEFSTKRAKVLIRLRGSFSIVPYAETVF